MSAQVLEKLILRELNENDEAAFLEGLADWAEGDRTWFTFDWKPGMPYAEFLERHKDNVAGLNLSGGFVPMTMLYAFIGNRIVGRVSIRHVLNDQLRARGGHLGYSVAPSFRKRGYATEMFKQALPYCRRLGITALLLTCSEANTASWKVIEKAGGVLTDTVFDESAKEIMRRYWLLLRPTTPAAFKPQPTIETASLILRPLTLKDAKAFQQTANDEKISATTSHPFPYTVAFAEERIATEDSRFHKGESVYFGLFKKATDKFVGGVLLFGILNPHSKAELGYWIGVDFWNKGYATEAVSAALKYGFDELGLNRIYAKYVATNEASGKVMIKAGMKREGQLREEVHRGDVVHDLVYYGILKSEFNN